MTQEEKAKAYDEALKKAAQLIKNCGDNNGRKEMIRSIFSELKESEDERIREVIMQVLSESTCYKDDCYKKHGVSMFDVFAWIEKQGEQSLANSAKTCKVEPKFNNAEWSEEDENKLNRICGFLWKNRKGDTSEIYQQEKDIAWLKSLRPQNHWKPSDEQLNALYNVLNPADEVDKNQLESLYNDLKKL